MSKGLAKIYSNQIDLHYANHGSNHISYLQFIKLIEEVVSHACFHPSILIVGFLYFDRFMKKSPKNYDLMYFKTHFLVSLNLACKMYEDVNDFEFKLILKKQSSQMVEIERNILNVLEYDLVMQYDDFLELIEKFSEDIHSEVADSVLNSISKIC
eukprot:gene11633-4874_t